MKDELKILAEQVDFRELHLARFKLGYNDEKNCISMSKGLKAMRITYDCGNDTYKVSQMQWKKGKFEEEEFTDVYSNQLKEYIQYFFGFTYVMKGIVGGEEDVL